NLVQAAPLMHKNEGKAKIYFIIGQIYQQLGFEAEAYNNYRESLKNGPEYELSFYAKLYMYQVYNLNKSNDVKKVRNYFTKLIKDSKNKEYRDKIYFEMAEFEAKQENMDKAIQHYNSSIQASTKNPRQKSYSYLQLGKIYYEKIKDYELAKLYYDSTISVMPKDEPDYASISARQVILKDFVEQLNIISFQDSLISLSKMDSSEVVAMIDKELEKEESKRKKEQVKGKKGSKSSSSLRNDDNIFANEEGTNSSSGGNFYFYNATAVGTGQSEFARIWGNRKLEDNWRRANKEAVPEFAQGNAGMEQNDNSEINEGPSAGAIAKESLLKQIPYKEADKKVALDKIEKAYFRLGNIYNFDLLEKSNAGETFETLLERFPNIENEPEVLYFLYLIYKELEDDKHLVYKDKVLNTYPNSTYAKIIRNPNYKQESDIANEKLKVIYKDAYTHYHNGDYDASKELISVAFNDYPDTDFRDHLKILEILLIGKTENVHNYQFALKNFITDYKESELVPYAQKLLKASEDLLKRIVAEKGAQYIEYFDQNHFLIIMYKPEGNLSDQLPQQIDSFNEKNFSGTNLKAANLKFDNDRSIIIITEFKDRNQALKYYEKFNAENVVSTSEKNENLDNFVISKDNFQIFYKTKDFKNYISFFQKHYK
ncbi:MAG: methyltransferase, partial [Bacteroidota bacterium]|nr:methyltransferase [Bacteroidota bacterium]